VAQGDSAAVPKVPLETGNKAFPRSHVENSIRAGSLLAVFLIGAAVLVVVLPVYRRWAPWMGLTPAQVTAVVRHRNAGLAYLEGPGGSADLAEREFRTITTIAPYVALGHANLAAAMLARPEKHAEALAEARTAVGLAPRNAAMRQLLAQLLAPSDGYLRQAWWQTARPPDDFDGAIEELQAALTAEPNNARVLFQWAELCERRSGDDPLAPARGLVLQQLARCRPDNLVAQLLWLRSAVRTGRVREARATLDRVAHLAQPWPSSCTPFLAASRAALRAGDLARAAAAIQILSNLLRVTSRHLADWKALQSSPGDLSGYAVPDFSPPPPPPAPLSHAAVRFVDVSAAMGLPANGSARSPAASGSPAATALAVAPVAENGPLALYVASPAGGRLFLLQGGRLIDTTRAAGLAGTRGTVAALIDVDSDRKPDLYLAGRGPDRIFRGLGGGRFQRTPIRGLPVAPAAGPDRPRTGAGPALSVQWADIDHDGALDLLRLEQSPGSTCAARLFRNNGDGTFTEITRSAGLAPLHRELSSTGARYECALFDDFDDDQGLDLFIAGGEPPGELYVNRRGPYFTRAGAASGLRACAGLRAASADVDGDGRPDLVVVGSPMNPIALYRNLRAGVFRADRALPPLPAGFAPRDVAFLDFDNDGEPDLVLAGQPRGGGSGGLRLLRGEGGGAFTDATAALPILPAACAVVPADLDGDGATDLVVLRDDGGLTLLRNVGGARNHWLDVTLEGFRQGVLRNNCFGLGATIEVMWGRHHQKQTVQGPVTHFGLGPKKTAIDVVRVVWPSGMCQNLVGPWAPNLDTRIHEREYISGW
jgi:FG-GAP-like repeat/ASPIC and UnbV